MQETTKETEVKDQAEQNTVQEPQAEKAQAAEQQTEQPQNEPEATDQAPLARARQLGKGARAQPKPR